MLRFLARFIGLWLLAAAVLALVVDGSKSIAASGIVTTTVGELLRAISPTSLEQAEAAVRDYVHPVLWDPVIVWVLLAPVFAVAGLLGALLLFLGQKPRAPLPELEAR